MHRRGIKFYITEHESSLNDQIRILGGDKLLDSGVIRRTITLALRDAGLEKPYELENTEAADDIEYMESEEKLAEFEWAFGEDAEDRLKSWQMLLRMNLLNKLPITKNIYQYLKITELRLNGVCLVCLMSRNSGIFLKQDLMIWQKMVLCQTKMLSGLKTE